MNLVNVFAWRALADEKLASAISLTEITRWTRGKAQGPNLLAIGLTHGYADLPLGDIVLEQLEPHIIINRIFAGWGCIKSGLWIERLNRRWQKSTGLRLNHRLTSHRGYQEGMKRER